MAKILKRNFISIVVLLGLLLPNAGAQAFQKLTQSGQIVFVSSRDGNAEIFLVNADGTQESRLTNSPENEIDPAWSRDGKQIAYLSVTDQNSALYSMDLDGNHRTKLSQDTEIVSGFRWSHTGGKIVYTSQSSSGAPKRILVVDTKDGSTKELVNDSAKDCLEPDWSLDDRRLVYSCKPMNSASGESAFIKSEIFVVDADGANKKSLLHEDIVGNHAPVWSPDGTWIALARVNDQEDGSKSGIFVVKPDGSESTRLSAHLGDTYPQWAPDGSHIAFTSTQGTGTELYNVNPDGTGLMLVINKLPVPAISWSPDSAGFALSFQADQASALKNYSLYYISSDGTGLVRLTESDSLDSSPNWSNKLLLGQVYKISGQVMDENLKPLKGVSVTTQNGQSAITDAAGLYQLVNLPGGNTYSIRASLNDLQFVPNSKSVTVPPEARGVDFRIASQTSVQISHMEVIQTIQDDQTSSDFPYIEAKPTVVRVYVTCEKDCKSIAPPSAVLHGYDAAGKELGSVTINFIDLSTDHSDWKDQQGKPSETFNFILPLEWIKGKVRLVAAVGNSEMEKKVDFQPGKKLTLAWLALPFGTTTKDPESNQNISKVVFPDSEMTAQSILQLLDQYPVSSEDVAYVYQPFLQQVMKTPFTCPSGSPSPDSCPAYFQYIQLLRLFWERMNREGAWVGNQQPDRLFAWLPDKAQGSVCGMADGRGLGNRNSQNSGSVAAGIDQCSLYNQVIGGNDVLVHEMGYLQNKQGLVASPSESPQVNKACTNAAPNKNSYPVVPGLPLGSILNWGMRLKNGYELEMFDPSNTYDFMSFCSPSWSSAFTFQNLNQGFSSAGIQTPYKVVHQSGKQLAALAPSNSRVANEQQVLISGMISKDGKATINPSYSISSREAASSGGEGPYCVEFHNQSGQTLDSACFDLNFTNPETGDPLDADIFTVALQYSSDAKSIVITRDNHLELARVDASPGIPQVQVISPNGGDTWEENQPNIIRWQASDPDGDLLHYVVSLSIDGGINWSPLVLDTTETSVQIDSSGLPGSKQAMIRVQASDGFNSAMDTSDAVFSIRSKPPKVHILTPSDSIAIPAGQSIWLRGYAEDPQDGNLTPDNLTWNSDQLGDLGNGNQILVNLPAGEHNITLTASGSDGQNSHVSVKVTSQTQADVAINVQNQPVTVVTPTPVINKIVIPSQTLILGFIILGALVVLLLAIILIIRAIIRWRNDKATEKRLASIAGNEQKQEPQKAAEESPPQKTKPDEPAQVPPRSIVQEPEPTRLDQSIQPEQPTAHEPEDPIKIFLDAGIADVKAGRVQEGYQKLRQVVQLYPQNADAWLWLGVATARNNDFHTAQLCFERAKLLGHPGADQALRWLQNNQTS